jgi:hypothetical protein
LLIVIFLTGISGWPAIIFSFSFPNGYGLPDSLSHPEMETILKRRNVLQDARLRLRKFPPSATPYTSTPTVNIMMEYGRVTGILDWEASGYIPVWWEYACAGIGLSPED